MVFTRIMNPSPTASTTTDPCGNVVIDDGVRLQSDDVTANPHPGDSRRSSISAGNLFSPLPLSTSTPSFSFLPDLDDVLVPIKSEVQDTRKSRQLLRRTGRTLPLHKRNSIEKNETQSSSSSSSSSSLSSSNESENSAASATANNSEDDELPPSLILEQSSHPFSAIPRSASVDLPLAVEPSLVHNTNECNTGRPRSVPTVPMSDAVPSSTTSIVARANAGVVQPSEVVSSMQHGSFQQRAALDSRYSFYHTVPLPPAADETRSMSTTSSMHMTTIHLPESSSLPSSHPHSHCPGGWQQAAPDVSSGSSTTTTTRTTCVNGDGCLIDESSAPSDSRDGHFDTDGVSAETASARVRVVVKSIALSATQNGGMLVKDGDGKPIALIDSDKADVSALFRSHKIQLTSLLCSDGDGRDDNNQEARRRALASIENAAPLKSNQQKFRRWTEEEDDLLRKAIDKETKSSRSPSFSDMYRPSYDWQRISRKYFQGIRTSTQCKNRWNKILQPGLKKTPFTAEEDAIIRKYMLEAANAGEDIVWSRISRNLPGRNQAQIRDRWRNALDPTLKIDVPWTDEENKTLFALQSALGNKWSKISKHLPGRNENQVKNHWHNAKTSQRRMMKSLAREARDQERMMEARQEF